MIVSIETFHKQIIKKLSRWKGEREQGSDRLDTEERKELNDSDFGLPEERKYPMPDATHVRAAESYFRYATDQQKPELAHNILRKAKEFGVDVESPTILEWANRY